MAIAFVLDLVQLRFHKKDICYVHVGKSGGGSIEKALVRMRKEGKLRSYVSIHSRSHRDCQAWLMPTVKDEKKCRCGAPLVPPSTGLDACCSTGNVLLWVRDPVSRMISTWNRNQEKKKEKFPSFNQTDLNTMLDSARKDNSSSAFEKVHTVLAKVPHATTDNAFYFGDKNTYPELWKERSTNCRTVLDQIQPYIFFVGRTEHYDADWISFTSKLTGAKRDSQALPLHVHASAYGTNILNPENVAFLRHFYKSEYDCIKIMVDKGWLGQEYWNDIISTTKQYSY
jgi:hypothetical protein